MIALLSGTPIFQSNGNLILNVGGVRYGVAVSSRCAAACRNQAPVTLFIHTVVREDAIELFGFMAEPEKELFLLLLSVSGIGPRTALAITEQPTPAIITAVQEANVTFFTKLPRVGKKLAQKIIIELTSKLGSLRELDLSPLDNSQQVVVDALLSLGFAEEESKAAARELPLDDISVEKAIQLAIKSISAHISK